MNIRTRRATWVSPERVLLLISLLLMVARLWAVERTIDYSGHPDERHLIQTARQILETGDPNPHFFRYPSLPIYLSTAGFGLSELLGLSADSGDHKFAASYGSGWPYEPRAAYFAPRLLFGLLGSLPILLVGLLAFMLLKSQPAATRYWSLFAPVALVGAPLIQFLAVRYMNVDTCAFLFTTACLSFVIVKWDRSGWLDKALVPGVLCGLATASKYNSGLVVAPALLAIAFSQSQNRVRCALVFGAISTATFFICVPYSIMDFPQFSADVLFEMEHYKKGHPGHEAEPGLSQLMHYLSTLGEQYGPGWLALAGLGAGQLLRDDWKRGLTVLSFPVLMIGYMCTNRVNFPRSVAPAFVVVPALIPLGAATLAKIFAQGPASRSGTRIPLPAIAAALVTLALTPQKNFHRLFDLNVERDSRSIALAHLPDDAEPASLLAPRALCLPERWNSAQASPNDSRQLLRQIDGHSGYVLLPRYASRTVPAHLRRSPKKKKAFLKAEKRKGSNANQRMERALTLAGATRLGSWGEKNLPTAGHPRNCVANPSLTLYRTP